MSHWLDDAARGLSEGRYNRRQVLRRGGAVAAGTLAASVTGPLAALTRATAAAAGVPCPDFNSPCLSPDTCCGGQECCDHATEFCCGGTCFKHGGRVGCCHNSSYDPRIEKCCSGLCCQGDCTAPAAPGITCCPNGGSTAGAAACAGPGYSGMGGCRGHKLGCVCDNGSFCPADTGCCDVFGRCQDPCP